MVLAFQTNFPSIQILNSNISTWYYALSSCIQCIWIHTLLPSINNKTTSVTWYGCNFLRNDGIENQYEEAIWSATSIFYEVIVQRTARSKTRKYYAWSVTIPYCILGWGSIALLCFDEKPTWSTIPPNFRHNWYISI